MKLVEIEQVNQGETHRQHPPGRLSEPDPERRYFASFRARCTISINGSAPFLFWKRGTTYGPRPDVALRRLYVVLGRML